MRTLHAALLCLIVSTGWAQELPTHDGSDELERIKKLAGTWTGEADHGNGLEPVTVVYRVTGGGSAVVETFNPGKPMEMVTVYHDRDAQLVMTHYCMLGNQPHMRLKKSTKDSLSLELVKESGIKKDEMHMAAMTIEFDKPDKIRQIWTLSTNGQTSRSPAITLTRKR